MIEVITQIGNLGILVVIAGVFLYDHLNTNKKVREALEQNTKFLEGIQDTNANITLTLALLKDSMEENKRISGSIEAKVDCIKRKAGYL